MSATPAQLARLRSQLKEAADMRMITLALCPLALVSTPTAAFDLVDPSQDPEATAQQDWPDMTVPGAPRPVARPPPRFTASAAHAIQSKYLLQIQLAPDEGAAEIRWLIVNGDPKCAAEDVKIARKRLDPGSRTWLHVSCRPRRVTINTDRGTAHADVDVR